MTEPTEPIESTLRNVLALRMKELRWTQADLARVLSVTQPSVSQFFRSGYAPRLASLTRYAGALGLDIEITVRPRENEASDG